MCVQELGSVILGGPFQLRTVLIVRSHVSPDRDQGIPNQEPFHRSVKCRRRSFSCPGGLM